MLLIQFFVDIMSSKLYLVYYAVQKVVLTFEDISWGHTWTTDPAQGGSNFLLCVWNPEVWPFKWKLLSSTFLWYCLSCCTRWLQLLSLWMKCNHSHVSHWAVLLCGASLKCQSSPLPNPCKICLLILILGAKPRSVHSLCRQRACYWRCF